MNDPGRIRDLSTDALPELRELFLDAQKPTPLAPAIDARLSAQIGTIAALPVSSVVKILPWLAGGGAVVLAGATMLLVHRRDPVPQAAPSVPATMSALAPAAPGPTLPAAPELPAPPVTRSQPPNMGRAVSAVASTALPEDALAAEANLLNQAHDAMATEPRQALAIAVEHAKRYPRGQLAAERELIWVQALVKLGRTREAEARGHALRRSTPNSIYGERLDTILHGR